MDFHCFLQRNKRQGIHYTSGFTLIELLVVIAIIAIIAAIVFPVFFKVRENARRTTCLNNLKQLGGCMQMYEQDWGGLPAARIFEGGEWNPYGNWAGSYYYGGACDPTKGQIYSYVKNIKVYMCPSAEDIYPLSYSMNAMLSYKSLDSSIESPSRVGLLIHEDSSSIDDGDFNWMRWAGVADEGRNKPSKIHNGGTCIIYCDLHAKWEKYDSVIKELENNDWNPENS